jgi:hypothetical protein
MASKTSTMALWVFISYVQEAVPISRSSCKEPHLGFLGLGLKSTSSQDFRRTSNFWLVYEEHDLFDLLHMDVNSLAPFLACVTICAISCIWI